MKNQKYADLNVGGGRRGSSHYGVHCTRPVTRAQCIRSKECGDIIHKTAACLLNRPSTVYSIVGNAAPPPPNI